MSYVVKARQRRDRRGQTAPGPQRSWTPRKLAAHHDAIAAHVRAHQDATLAELRAWLLAERGVSASIGTMWNTLRRLGLTFKKTRPAKLAGMLGAPRWPDTRLDCVGNGCAGCAHDGADLGDSGARAIAPG
ncbi:MAG: winged helix-turn-helix domain-containing protein [Acetobacteraceae bacterium]|nr:winged helix-turn-helix domain-containing protein [Acetobacteraceae bacterium]